MTSLRRALLALGAVSVVLAGLAVAIALSSDHLSGGLVQAAVVVAVMGSYIGTGLFAWWRRPGNRTGLLMAAIGWSAFLGALTWSDSPVLFTVGATLSGLQFVVAAHLLLAFPSGRLETRLSRLVVAAGYGLMIGVSIAYSLFSRAFDLEGEHPDNVLLVADEQGIADVVDAGGSALGLIVLATMAVILVRRWRVAPPRGRRALTPVLWTGAAYTASLALLLAADTVRTGAWVGEAVALLTFAALPYAYLLGLVRSRAWQAGAVGELLEALSEAPRRGRLRDVLAGALADPSLELAYWLPERERYVDVDGHPVTLPTGDERVVTEVERDGRRVGAIVHDPVMSEGPALVRHVGAAAALALDNERLEAELRARVEDLQRSRLRLLEVGLAERRRIERDLHDGAQQRLVSLSLQLGLVAAKLDHGDEHDARALLDQARGETRAALEDLRELARGIHPAVLTDRGLRPALEALADRAPLPVDVEGVPDGRLPDAVEAAAYFVVAESLTNVAKYADASWARVSVGREDGFTLVEVRDDGVGGADPRVGTGLRGLADRLAALDGRLEIDSEPGHGTVVRARVPWADPAPVAR